MGYVHVNTLPAVEIANRKRQNLNVKLRFAVEKKKTSVLRFLILLSSTNKSTGFKTFSQSKCRSQEKQNVYSQLCVNIVLLCGILLP